MSTLRALLSTKISASFKSAGFRIGKLLSKKLIAGCCFFDSFYYKGNLYKIGDTIKIDAEGQEIWIGEINSIYYDEKGTERSDDENSSKDNSEDEESDDNSVDDDCFFVDVRWFFKNTDYVAPNLKFPEKELLYSPTLPDKNPISVIIGHCNVKFCLESVPDTSGWDEDTYYCRYFYHLDSHRIFRLYTKSIRFSPDVRKEVADFQKKKFPYTNFSKVSPNAITVFELFDGETDLPEKTIKAILAPNFPMLPANYEKSEGVEDESSLSAKKKESGPAQSAEKDEAISLDSPITEDQAKAKDVKRDGSNEETNMDKSNTNINNNSNSTPTSVSAATTNENPKEKAEKLHEPQKDANSAAAAATTVTDQAMLQTKEKYLVLLPPIVSEPQGANTQTKENSTEQVPSPLQPSQVSSEPREPDEKVEKAAPRAEGEEKEKPLHQKQKKNEKDVPKEAKKVYKKEKTFSATIVGPSLGPPPSKYPKVSDEPDSIVDLSLLKSVAKELKSEGASKQGKFDPSKLVTGGSIWTLSTGKKPQISPSDEVCKNYLKGLCTQGVSCPFKHESPEFQRSAAVGRPRPELSERIRSHIVSKTKIISTLKSFTPKALDGLIGKYAFVKNDKCIRYETDPICILMKIVKITPCFSSRQPQKLIYGFTLCYEGVKDSEVVLRSRELAGVPSKAVENEAIERYIEITRGAPSMAKRKD